MIVAKCTDCQVPGKCTMSSNSCNNLIRLLVLLFTDGETEA